MFYRNKTILAFIPVVGILVGCDAQTELPAPTQTPPTRVEAITLISQPVTLEQILPGRVIAFRTAQIRPQVSGIITATHFSQGSEVQAGQTLFQIDPAPFRMDVNSAIAAVEKAEASHRLLHSRATRINKLQGSGAISPQDYEEAVSNAAQAKAAVAEARAVLARKQLELSYATVKAPIAGRIDQYFVTEGALVNHGDPQAMATVQQIDSVYVDVRQPASARQPLPVGATTEQPFPLQADILSTTGNPVNHHVRIVFTGVSVDPGTGDVVMRLEVENKPRTLLPGMYVQAKISQPLATSGLLIPQEALVRKGDQTQVWLDDNGHAKAVTVTLGEMLHNHYVVRTGLKAGDRLITLGTGRLQEGMPIETDDQHPNS